MNRRTFAQAATIAPVSFPLVMGTAARAQNAPHPPDPASTPASGGEIIETDVPGVRTFAADGQPLVLSPDGKWLAGPGPDEDFCIWDVETLTPMAASDRRPLRVQPDTITWAPDSSAVAFTLDSARLFVDSDIYVMDTEGTLHNLTDDGENDKISLTSDGPEIPIDMFPAWSPDGEQLIFARTVWGSANRSTTLCTVPRAGGEVTQRIVVTPIMPMTIYSPMHWLEDDSVVFSVLQADLASAQNGVWRLTATGGIERILEGNEDADLPAPFVNAISADGRYATVMSFMRVTQMDRKDDVFFVLDLETGEVVPLSPSEPGPVTRLISAGVFLPGDAGILSLESDGERFRLVTSALDGTVTGSVDLPEDSGPPVSNTGLSVAANGTAFVPTINTQDNGMRGGLLIDLAEVGLWAP